MVKLHLSMLMQLIHCSHHDSANDFLWQGLGLRLGLVLASVDVRYNDVSMDMERWEFARRAQFDVAVMVLVNWWSCSVVGCLVLGWMTVSGFNSVLRNLSWHANSHPCQLSLAIPQCWCSWPPTVKKRLSSVTRTAGVLL